MSDVWARAAMVAALFVAGHERFDGPAAAQELRLGRPAPPQLGDESFCAKLALELTEEIDLLTAAAVGEADPLLRNILDARANVRMISRRLVQLAHSAGAGGNEAALLGATLHNGLGAMDRALSPESWPPDFAPSNALAGRESSEPDRFSDAYWSLVRFNEMAVQIDHLLADLSTESLDMACETLLTPLREALEAVEDRLAISHWIVLAEEFAVPPDPDGGGGEIVATITLAERLAAVNMPEETRDLLAEINAMLDAAREFPEFQRQAEAYRTHVEDAIAFAEVLAAAEWAPADVRNRALARLHAAVVLFQGKATRGAGRSQLARLTESRRFLERLNQLSSLPRHRLRPTALLDAFLNTQDILGEPGRTSAAAEHLLRLHGVLERMIAWRRMREPQLRRDLKVISATLDRTYEQAEERLLEALASLGETANVGADPNLLALLSNHAQIMSDLEHVQSIPRWTEQVEAVRPTVAERFDAQARRIAAQLIDPARRAAATAAMNDLATWMKMLFPMPYEDALRAATAEAAAMTAGQHQAILAEVERSRVQWLDARAEGDPDREVESRLRLLHGLLRGVSDMAELSRSAGSSADLLNRWSGWELSAQACAPALVEAPNRLRLASQAAATGNVEDLERQLDRIEEELPLALLIVRLRAFAGPDLEALPQDALATVEQVASPAGHIDGWMITRRDELSSICRYAAEESFARSRGHMEVADACAAYVNALARDLAKELDSGGR